MWLLKKVSEEGPVQYLVSEKKFYTVGRKNTDIVLSDNSVSRTHCILNVAVKNECPFSVNTITGVWIIDKKSKYGTFIQKNYEWIKIEEEKVEQLSNGSIIRFGVLENIWRLEYKPVIACSSRLSNTQMGEMKRLLATIDGRIVSKWVKQCNVVFVNDITLTVKVLLALINGIPIVTMNYLTKLVECVKQNQGWPDYKLFRPEIKESTLIPSLVSLDVEDHRKELFKGKTFVIPTNEQLENLRDIIEAAGGRVELLKLDGNWRQLVNENVIVVQLPCDKIINPDKNASSFRTMASVLKNEYHTRVVPETEIFQAIAYSSTEKYCSPRSAAFDLRQCSSNQHSQGHVLEEETPTQSNIKDLSENGISNSVNEGVGFHISERDKSLSKKRYHSPEPEEMQKKFAVEDCRTVEDISEFSEPNCTPSRVVQAEKFETRVESPSANLANRKRESYKTPAEPSIEESKIVPKKQKSIKENFQRKLSDFWKESEKKNHTGVDKRKLSENENDSSAKRICTTTESNSSAEVDSKTRKEISSEALRNDVSDDNQRTKKYINIKSDFDTTGVIRWKTDPNTTLNESCGQRKNFRKFKREDIKSEEHTYSEEEYQTLRKSLLKDGWIEYRRKTELIVG